MSMKNVVIIQANNSDKYIHTFAYFILSISWLLAFKEKAKIKHVSALIFFLILAYGIIIEVFQDVLTKNRQADFLDVIANSIGIIVALVLFNLVFIKKKRK